MNTCKLRSIIHAAKLKIRFQKRQIKRALKYSKVTIYVHSINKKETVTLEKGDGIYEGGLDYSFCN